MQPCLNTRVLIRTILQWVKQVKNEKDMVFRIRYSVHQLSTKGFFLFILPLGEGECLDNLLERVKRNLLGCSFDDNGNKQVWCGTSEEAFWNSNWGNCEREECRIPGRKHDPS